MKNTLLKLRRQTGMKYLNKTARRRFGKLVLFYKVQMQYYASDTLRKEIIFIRDRAIKFFYWYVF